jgi:metal-responsive CopG/Arc/MetJ family transcriptional regulator
MNTAKIATSLPTGQFRELEQVRRRLGLKRSEAVQQALALWLATHREAERTEQYIKGYLRHPEDEGHGVALALAWATGLEPEDWE